MSLLPVLVFLLLSGAFGGDHHHPEPPAPKPPPPPPPEPGPSPAPAPKPAPKPVAPRKGQVLPASFPVAVPKDLPPWPSGWEPDVPVPPSEVKRAYELLPTLWKSGKPGGKAIEQTGGKWVTYLAFVPSKGKRGVAAYRMKEGASPGGGQA